MTSLLIALTALPLSAHAAPVTLNLTNVEARGGQLLVGLQTGDQFLKNGGIAGEIVEAPEPGTLTFTFDVPEGRYSASVLHDENKDGTMSVGANGMPAEGWTMHNADKLMGPPTFDLVGFDVPPTGLTLTMDMIYPEAE
tara:strand:- start:30932 stop:31348 length:417 start_codon:yes stop_codon:yes gene_type:complete